VSGFLAAWAQALADGWLLDLILVGVVLEIAALLLWHRFTGGGLPARILLPNLLAGLCLMAAVRAATAGAHPAWIGAALTGAAVAHVADLRQRWPRGA
jgi:hypothetical protein